MAENVDPKKVAALKAENEALKKKKGRKVLTKAMKEREDFFNKGYEEGKKEAEAAGKGKFGQIRAGFKRANEKEDEFQAATMGTKRNKEKFFRMFGIEMGDWARKNLEDKVSPEEQAAAKSKLGLDKKEKEKPSAKKTKAGLVGSDKLMKEIVGIRNTVQSLAKFILVNRGFTSEIDPKTGKILYRNKAGQFAKSQEATFANFKNVSMKDKKTQKEKERGMTLGSKINADEDPQIRIADTLEAILKTLGQGDVSIQERLDRLESNQGGGGGGLGLDDLLGDSKRRRRGPRSRGKFGKILGGIKNVAGKIGGRGLGLLSKLGVGAAAAGAAATGVGAGLGATTAGAAAAGSAGSAALEQTAKQAAPAIVKSSSKVLGTAKNVLKFLKKVPGLSLLASGAALIMQISNAIDANEKGEINDVKLHSVIAGAVGGALGGLGGAELVGLLGASVGTMIFPGVGTFIGGVLGGTAGFFAGEGLGQAAGEKLFSYFQENTEAPAEAIKAAEKANQNLKPAAASPTQTTPAAASPTQTTPAAASPTQTTPAALKLGDWGADEDGIPFSNQADAYTYYRRNPDKLNPNEPGAKEFLETVTNKPKESSGESAASASTPMSSASSPPQPTAAPPVTPPPPPSKSSTGGGDADVKGMIRRHEGVRFKPYKDSLGLWTVGVGHLIGDGKTLPPEYDREFTQQEVDAMFDKDFEYHQAAAEKIPGYDDLNPKGQGALTDLTFNMGPSWYKKWPKFTSFLSAGNTEGAAQSLETSKWYGQVGRRAPEVVSMLRAGGEGDAAGLPESKPSQSGTPSESAGLKAAASDGGTMVASTGGNTPRPVQSTTGSEMAAQSNDYQNTQMVAQNQPPSAPVIVNNNSGGNSQPPTPKAPLPKAGTRSDDGSFMRALAKDFSHPSAFTTVSMV